MGLEKYIGRKNIRRLGSEREKQGLSVHPVFF
jgi:hypothetical protein